MIKDTHNKRKWAYKSIMAFVFLGFLIFGLFNGFSVKTAQAENNYISNISFYKNTTDGYNHIKFYVKTSFTTAYQIGFFKTYSPTDTVIDWAFNCENNDWIAGNTYDFAYDRDSGCGKDYHTYTSANYMKVYSGSLTEWPYWQLAFSDTEKYYFSEEPTLNITYPLDNAEIAEAFNITGNYSIPETSNFTSLWVYLREEDIFYLNWFIQDLETKSGSVDIRIAGVPYGDNYGFSFYFKGGGEAPYDTGIELDIKIVADIPYELPYTQEVPPESFDPLDPLTIYGLHSNYPTSTPLFDAFTDALKPLMVVIGENLTYFSTQFNQSDAKQAGEKAGKAVLLIRGYIGNINSFFSDLPISEVLFLYLSALVAVIVFRIIRLILKLIPFT